MNNETTKTATPTATTPFWLFGQPAQPTSGATPVAPPPVPPITAKVISQPHVTPAVETVVEEKAVVEVAKTTAPPAMVKTVSENADDVVDNADADSENEETETTAKKPEPVSNDEKRRQHEESEAKRKAEWEAKQVLKKATEAKALEELSSMSDTELAEASAKRVGADTERITRRNMKDCVTAHVQALCVSDVSFARKVMHPRKTMLRCFHYINRMANDFVKKEMEDNDEKPMNGGYGCDVPDDLCYQWAVDYFNDPDAKEDKDKDDEFVPKTFYGGGSSSKKKDAKKKDEKKPVSAVNAEPAAKPIASDSGQIDLFAEVDAA